MLPTLDMCSSAILFNDKSDTKPHDTGPHDGLNHWNRARFYLSDPDLCSHWDHFQKIAGITVITGIIPSDPNNGKEYMKTRLKYGSVHIATFGRNTGENKVLCESASKNTVR